MEERMRVGYRYNVVDIHSHIVPGVDDGAEDIQESMALLHAAREQGIRDVIATPHYGIENGFAPKADKVRFAFEKVLEAQKKGSEDLNSLRLYLGEEVYCADDAAERFKSGKALRINETCYALVEFLEFGMNFESGKEIFVKLEKLVKSHVYVKPILAHAERYRALQKDHDYLKKIQDLGVLIQVNAYDLALNKHEQTRETAQWLAEQRMISFIGSDMHGVKMDKKAPKIREGVDWLYDHTDRDYADCVVRKNAEKMLRVKKYDPWSEDDYFMSPRLATFFEEYLHGRIVRCQVFPQRGDCGHSLTSVELEDGRAYAIVDGPMGPRMLKIEAYADESNSYFGSDDTSWYWKWKGSDQDVERKWLGGVRW